MTKRGNGHFVIQEWVLIIIGVFLVIYQFLLNRSLWHDEAALALNIISRSYAELLTPLDHEQVAPHLYLLLTKFFSTLIAEQGLALRILSPISYIASIILFYKVLQLLISNRAVVLVALAVFVFSSVFLRYGTELKQYMTEVLITLLLVYFSLKEYDSIRGKFINLAVAGAISVFLSNITPLVLTGVGLALFVVDYLIRKEISLLSLISLALIWLVPFSFNYYFFIHDHPLRSFMHEFWSAWGGFLPSNPFSADFYGLLFEKFRQVTDAIRFIPFLKNVNFLILGLLTFSGSFIFLMKKRYKELILLAIPVAMHILLSMASFYPFYLRLVLYLVPLIIIISSIAIDQLLQSRPLNNKVFAVYMPYALVLLITLSFGYGIYIKNHDVYPIRVFDKLEIIKHAKMKSRGGDMIFAFRGLHKTLEYYQQTGVTSLNPDRIVLGNSIAYFNKDGFLDEINALPDGNYWFLFSRAMDGDTDYIKSVLEQQQNMERIDEFNAWKASVVYYRITNHRYASQK